MIVHPRVEHEDGVEACAARASTGPVIGSIGPSQRVRLRTCESTRLIQSIMPRLRSQGCQIVVSGRKIAQANQKG